MKTVINYLLIIALVHPQISWGQLTAREWYQQGLIASSLSEKENCFDNAIQIDENFADAYFQKGLLLIQKRQLPNALGMFNTAIRIDSKKEYFEGRGMAYMEAKNYAKALNDFDEYLKANAGATAVLYKKSEALEKLARFDEALQSLDKLLGIVPLHIDGMLLKGAILLRAGRLNETQHILENVLKYNKDNFKVLYMSGLLAESRGNIPEALSYYRQVVKLNPKHQDSNNAIYRLENPTPKESEETVVVQKRDSNLPTLDNFKRKYGLFIGNSAYQNIGALMNKPINDAKAMANKMASPLFGFECQLVTDLTKSTFDDVITQFCERVEGADVVFLFYAGHGAEREGLNYLLPIDMTYSFEKKTLPVNECIELQALIHRLQSRNVKYLVVVTDACRTLTRSFTPDTETVTKIQIKTEGRSNYYIGYATLSGSPADNNGPYTEALITSIQKGVRLDDSFRRARQLVRDKTKGAQLPENTEGMDVPFIW